VRRDAKPQSTDVKAPTSLPTPTRSTSLKTGVGWRVAGALPARLGFMPAECCGRTRKPRAASGIQRCRPAQRLRCRHSLDVEVVDAWDAVIVGSAYGGGMTGCRAKQHPKDR